MRSDSPKLVEATEKLQTLLAMVQADNALAAKRREVLIVTLKYDLSKVREIAGERRRASPPRNRSLAHRPRATFAGATTNAASRIRAAPGKDADSIIESRGRSVADCRVDRSQFSDGFTRVMRSVDKSAMPDGRDITFPKDWVEMSQNAGRPPRRSRPRKRPSSRR